MRGRWMLVAMAIPAIVAAVALYLAVDNIAQAGPGGAPAAAPSVPTVISYQGRLTDPGTGQPMADGSYNMRFRIYDAATGGALLWQEPAAADPAASVPVTGGVFTVLLGSSVALDASVFAGGSAYLEVEVNGETLAPRQQIGAVAYALVAETLDGNSLTDLDDRYVNVPGDTMTGNLTIAGGQSLLTVGATGNEGDIWVQDSSGRTIFNVNAQNSLLTLGAGSVTGESGNEGDLWIKNTAGDNTFTVDGGTGNVTYSGALIGAFPRPAYDSGFVAIDAGDLQLFTHNIGGNPENYFVDLRCKDTGGFLPNGITNLRVGLEDMDGGADHGAYWLWLSDTNIYVFRGTGDPICDQVQVRIWEIK